ncbi:MAG TPA: carbonic anhydrase [Thermoanaerobaculia bacterium]|jgi:carbonic anhydrase|nr:carbonic anhydrase [Thermoanaerobaculia bacterium]
MERAVSIASHDDVPEEYRGTPVERLLAWHNGFGDVQEPVVGAEMLIGMCMDNRKKLRIPENFAFILRAGGGNLRPSEFKVSFAVAVGGVRAIAIIVHNHCGMVGLSARREQFVDGLVDAGWEREPAEQHFDSYAPLFEIGNEIDFVLAEAKRLRARYPKVLVAPLLYNVDDNRLYCLREV